jgi:NAD-dependent deacetylase
VNTFRDQGGLWENHRIDEVASPEGFRKNPSLVYDFYNKRRKELNSGIKPNRAHYALSELEQTLKINIITQNIDNLHEKSGSSSIIHMHGELNKASCIKNEHILTWTEDLNETHKCTICGSQLRPHIVWFGEMPLQMDEIHAIALESSLFISVGTSGEVYPAAGFVSLFKEMKKPTVELNLEPSSNKDLFDFAIYKPATIAVEEFKNKLLKIIY